MPRSGHIRPETLPYANIEYLITAVTAAVKLYNRLAAQTSTSAFRSLTAAFSPYKNLCKPLTGHRCS